MKLKSQFSKNTIEKKYISRSNCKMASDLIKHLLPHLDFDELSLELNAMSLNFPNDEEIRKAVAFRQILLFNNLLPEIAKVFNSLEVIRTQVNLQSKKIQLFGPLAESSFFQNLKPLVEMNSVNPLSYSIFIRFVDYFETARVNTIGETIVAVSKISFLDGWLHR